MAISTQLYRFKIELADIERSVYQSLDFRVAQHPSESLDYLLTRVLAYALNYQEGLKFSAEGLHNPDEPCLSIINAMGGHHLWIEIGNPNARKLHKAAKSSEKVKVYTYKNPNALLEDVQNNTVHRSEELEIYALKTDFLEQLSKILSRECKWNITYNDGTLMIACGETSLQGELIKAK